MNATYDLYPKTEKFQTLKLKVLYLRTSCIRKPKRSKRFKYDVFINIDYVKYKKKIWN